MAIFKITSLANPEIRKVRALREKKYRIQQQQCIAEGIRACSTLLQNSQLAALYVIENYLDQAHTLITRYISSEATPLIRQVSDSVMKKISTSTTPSGILGVFNIPQQPDKITLTSGIVLADITDPGNMGTLIRSAAAMSVKTVVIIGGTDCWAPKVIQASAGTIGLVNILTITWQELLQYKKDQKLYALVVSGGAPASAINRDNALLVIGNEAHGLTEAQIHNCDYTISLTMPGKTESLNAAVAGSIALYLTFAQ